MQFSSGMGQVSKSSYFASANDVLMIDDYQIEIASSIPVYLPFVLATLQHRK